MACLGSIKVRPDIVVANQAELELKTTFARKPQRSRNPGIRHRHHDVSLNRLFLRQVLAQQIAALIHRTAKDLTVGSREIDMFENAER